MSLIRHGVAVELDGNLIILDPKDTEEIKNEVNEMIENMKHTRTVVFCKDCKYCEDESYTDEDTGEEVKYLVCDRWYEQDDADGNMFPKADDFCSRGERKDG